MPQIKLCLFGPPRLERDGHVVEIRPRKALALLVFLAVTQQPHSRDVLATLFWPESDQRTARASLRRVLYRLNQAIGRSVLAITADTVELDLQADIWLDVVGYRQHLSAGMGEPPAQSLVHLVDAAELYSDDFLAGFTLPDCPEFDEWQFFQREELRHSLAQVLERLVYARAGEGELDQAIFYARRWLALDPLHEPAHRQLMQLYAWSGQQPAALRQYQECQRILDEELGAPPEKETTDLYEAIRTKRILPSPAAATQQVPERKDPLLPSGQPPAPLRSQQAAFSAAGRSTHPHNLPARSTPFVGRKQELAEIVNRLRDPACRLLTLVGPGGIGKTRLAIAAAQALSDGRSETEDGNHRILFVPLATVTTPGAVVSAIGEAAGFSFFGDSSPRQQILAFLSEKQLLLVLDDFEHLLRAGQRDDSLRLISDILAAAPGVQILVTSREALSLQEEWFHAVSGMAVPGPWRTAQTNVKAFDAVRLFEQCARRARIGFSLAAEERHVVRVCQLVNGVPLAIELAASWLKVLTVENIADEIQRGLDILTARHNNVPDRHRSMRIVIEQSWEMLSENERDVFKRLSVFQGSFQREAAEQVAGASLMALAALVDKSLLLLAAPGRYQIHELLRQFAAERMSTTDPAEREEVRDRHSAYYSTFLHQRTADIKGRRPKEALEEIAADIDNIRAAWRWSVARRDARALDRSAQCLWLFCHSRGALYEGEAAFREAVAAFSVAGTGPIASRITEGQENLVGFLLAGLGWMVARRGSVQDGRSTAEEGIALLRRARRHDRPREAFALAYLSLIAQFQGRNDEAAANAQESLAYFTEIGDRWGMAVCYQLLGTSALGNGDLTEAEELLQRCLAVCRETGERRSRLRATIYLGVLNISFGEYSQAQHYLDAAVQICQELGDSLGMATVLRDLGKLAMDLGQYGQSIQYLQRSLAILEELGISDVGAMVLGSVLDHLGSVLRLQGDYAAAEQVFQRSCEMARNLGHKTRLANCRRNLGCLAYDRQDYSDAQRYQIEALALWQEAGLEPGIASAQRYLGHIAAAMDEPHSEKEVGQHYGQALRLAAKHRLAPVALDVFVGVAGLLARAGRHGNALAIWSFAENHPAGTHETKETARRNRQALIANRPVPKTVEESHLSALGWEALAEQLVQELSDLAPAPLQTTTENFSS